MSQLNRYVVVPAIKTSMGELIPIWDERLKYTKTEEFGTLLRLEGEYPQYSEYFEVIYDLKKRTLSPGIEIDFYPKEGSLEFSKGEEVYVEAPHNSMKEVFIYDVVFEEYDLDIYKGSKLEEYQIKHYGIKSLEKDKIYAIKRWKPTYVLSDGSKIKYDFKLKHKLKE